MTSAIWARKSFHRKKYSSFHSSRTFYSRRPLSFGQSGLFPCVAVLADRPVAACRVRRRAFVRRSERCGLVDGCHGDLSFGRSSRNGANWSANPVCNGSRRRVLPLRESSPAEISHAQRRAHFSRNGLDVARAFWNLRRAVLVVCLCRLDFLRADRGCAVPASFERAKSAAAVSRLGLSVYTRNILDRGDRAHGEFVDRSARAVHARTRRNPRGHSILLPVARNRARFKG